MTFDPFSQAATFGSVLTAGYTGEGLRAWKQAGSSRTYTLYDGSNPVVTLDASGNVAGSAVWGAHGLLSTARGSTVREYAWDAQGGLSLLLGTNTSVMAAAMWDAWEG